MGRIGWTSNIAGHPSKENMKTSVTILILSILSIVVEVTCADLEDDLGDDGLPMEVDWRTKDVVTSVKNQHVKSCSSCWAFSTTGALEGQWKLVNGNLYNLSVQQLVDCNKANHGCEGGWPARAFSYIINAGGINSEEEYPYTARDGTCNITKPFIANMINYEFVTGYNETDLKRAVAEIGPISVTIFASDKFDNYSRGIFKCNETASKRHSNHAVLVVGYGRTLDYQDYWIVKNSYGTKWGENGYMRMGTNNFAENPCGIA